MSGHAVKFDDIPIPLQPVAKDIADQVTVLQPAWTIKATLTASGGFELKVPKITQLSIHEEFEAKVCDFINMTIEISIFDMRKLELFYRDLDCTLEFYRADPEQGIVSSQPAFTIKWCAVFTNRGSIYRNATPNQLNNLSGEQQEKQQMVQVQFSLYNPGSMDLRNKKTSGVFRDMNVTEMIYWIAYTFGAKTVDMKPAQNTIKYENFILEPMHYVNDIFDYIQYRYGIYQYGVSVYYFGKGEKDSALFIYPPFMYDPPLMENETPTEIIYVGQRTLQFGVNTSKKYPKGGKKVVHNGKTVDIAEGLKILCSNIGDQFSPGDVSADSVGTISLVFKANKIVDQWRDITQDDQYRCVPKHKKDVIDGMAKDMNLNGFASSHYNPRYDVSYNNGRVITSKLAQANCDIVTLRWTGAIPWTFKPGRRIIFTYGEATAELVNKIPGICSEIVYAFTPIKGNVPGVDYFECAADLILKLKRTK